MIIAFFLSFQLSVAPTLEEVLRIEPREAGELVLQTKRHGHVVIVEKIEENMAPPESARLDLVEEAIASGDECQRTRWTAKFRDLPEDRSTNKILSDVYSTTEITFAKGGSCPSEGYVRLNPSVTPEQGFMALKSLNDIRRGTVDIDLSCSDETSSDLCSSSKSISDELNRLDPWAISRKDDGLEIWLGTPGQTVTGVRYSSFEPLRVSINRRIPAPF